MTDFPQASAGKDRKKAISETKTMFEVDKPDLSEIKKLFKNYFSTQNPHNAEDKNGSILRNLEKYPQKWSY